MKAYLIQKWIINHCNMKMNKIIIIHFSTQPHLLKFKMLNVPTLSDYNTYGFRKKHNS